MEESTNEMEILRLLVKNRGYYDKYFSIVQKYITSRDLKTLYEAIDAYYQESPNHTYISEDDLKLYFSTNYPQLRGTAAFDIYIDSIYSMCLSSDTIKNYVHKLIENDTYRAISNITQDALLTRSYGKLGEIEAKLLTYQEVISREDKESPFLDIDMRELLTEESEGKGFKWRLQCLNDDVGPLGGSTLTHIFARPECFTPDTEVLTPNGWRYVNQITYKDKIACVDKNRGIHFEKPSHIEAHEEIEMYNIHDTLGRVNLCVSGGHQMVYEFDGNGLQKKAARDIKYFQGVKHHIAGYGKGSKVFTAFDALQIAYQADGHTRNYKEYGYTFSFKKQCKIDRLKGILAELQYEYTTYKDGNRDNIGFYVKTKKPLSKDFNWLDLEEVSTAYAQDFIEELSYWDATRRTSKRYKYDTTNGAVADIVSAVASLAGYNCFISIKQDNRKESYNDVYSLSIRTNYQPVDGQCIIKEKSSYSGMVYCFSVSTGMLLVRRGLATAVVGNTGKTTFLASELTFFAEQLEEGEYGIWINNEEAGKKVKFRTMQAALKATKEEILAKIDSALSVFLPKWGTKIKIVDSATITFEQIQQICRDYKPKFLVVDQGDKVTFKGASDYSTTERLKVLYVKFRELAKELDIPIITVGQASGEAEGKKWLTMDWMDFSKCLAIGTKVRMYDGSLKCIENIKIGDQVMGVDSTPRNVNSTDKGISKMWKVSMVKTGDSFICNDNHILSTKMSGNYSTFIKNKQVINKSLHDWLALSPTVRYRHKGYYTDSIQYNNDWLSILDPYFIGMWLGDGSSRSSSITTADKEIEEYVQKVASKFGMKITEDYSPTYKTLHISCGKVNGNNPVLKELQKLNLINNKHIPKWVLTTSIWDRQKFLAGLIDTDGCLLSTKTHQYFEVATKYINICLDLIELCRSLGLYASYAIKYIKEVPYYYVYISGDISKIPTKITRKQTTFCAKTQVTTSPMEIESVGMGEYAGFTLDGDGLYMLENYIVTHNTGKPGEMDLIIGIGCNSADGEENIRYIRLAKNKISGKHGKHAVLINPERARYSDMG